MLVIISGDENIRDALIADPFALRNESFVLAVFGLVGARNETMRNTRPRGSPRGASDRDFADRDLLANLEGVPSRFAARQNEVSEGSESAKNCAKAHLSH
jgi:hypothetical protein